VPLASNNRSRRRLRARIKSVSETLTPPSHSNTYHLKIDMQRNMVSTTSQIPHIEDSKTGSQWFITDYP